MSSRRISSFPAFPASDCLEYQEEIQRALHRVMSGGNFILGHEVEAFEEEFASYLGAKHAVGVGNGTDAIELMLRALGIGLGDKVVVPCFVPSAVASGVERAGATVVLADVDEQTLTLCPRALDRLLESLEGLGVRAVLAVHLYGHPVDWAELRKVASKHRVELLEDGAQAHGARWQTQNIGTLGRMAAFSFYPTKNLGAMGDAGAVVTSDAELASRVRQLRQYGWQRRHVSERSGINSRMDEMQAAVLRVKLHNLEAQVARRNTWAACYDQGLRRTPGIMTPMVREGCHHAFHQYVIRSAQRDRLHEHLNHHGIPAAVLYPSALHQQPAWHSSRSFPMAERAATEVLALPLNPYLKREALHHVIEVIQGFNDEPRRA
ncbi:MAG: DegT/DnrJ/EryC1/StrS family aminotransferase [Verrucomicrobiota bacterium]